MNPMQAPNTGVGRKLSEAGQMASLHSGPWLGPSFSNKLRELFPQPCKPRKAHQCRLCGERIEPAEQCCRWDGITPGEGRFTSHAHPECYQYTLDAKWDSGDWECMAPGDISRPNPAGEPQPPKN